MEREIKRTKQIGYSSVLYQTEVVDGEWLDTKVIVNDQLLCVIAGCQIDEFHQALSNVISSYSI
jgi:hypothetical protein